MPDYSKTIIYKICCKDKDITDIYVGHSTNLSIRKSQHKYCCNNENDKAYFHYVYFYIRENGGWDNWELIKLYDFPCLSRKEACIEEKNCCKKINAKLNMSNPYRTLKETKETIKEYNKQYRIIKVNCPHCKKLITQNNIQRHIKDSCKEVKTQ